MNQQNTSNQILKKIKVKFPDLFSLSFKPENDRENELNTLNEETLKKLDQLLNFYSGNYGEETDLNVLQDAPETLEALKQLLNVYFKYCQADLSNLQNCREIDDLNDKIKRNKRKIFKGIKATQRQDQQSVNNLSAIIKEYDTCLLNNSKNFWRKEFRDRVQNINIKDIPTFTVPLRVLILLFKIPDTTTKILITLIAFGIWILPTPSPFSWGNFIVDKPLKQPIQLSVEKNGDITGCKGNCAIQPSKTCKNNDLMVDIVDIKNVGQSTGTFLFALKLKDGSLFTTSQLQQSKNNNLKGFYSVESGKYEFSVESSNSNLSPNDLIYFFTSQESSLNGKYKFSLYCKDNEFIKGNKALFLKHGLLGLYFLLSIYLFVYREPVIKEEPK